MSDFYKTRMGQRFYERTMPDLVKQLDADRRANASRRAEGRRVAAGHLRAGQRGGARCSTPRSCPAARQRSEHSRICASEPMRRAQPPTGSADRRETTMPYLSPQTLTTDEQKLILRATAKHPRDHLIFSMALGHRAAAGRTGRPQRRRRLRPRRHAQDPHPHPPRDRQAGPGRGRVRAGQAGAEAEAVLAVQEEAGRGPRRRTPRCSAPSHAGGSPSAGSSSRGGSGRRRRGSIGCIRFMPAAHGGDRRLPGDPGPVPGAEVCAARVAVDDRRSTPTLATRRCSCD